MRWDWSHCFRLLRLSVLNRLEHLLYILAIESGEPAEALDTALQECLRHRHPQICADISDQPRNLTRVTDVGLHARGKRRVVPAEVHLGIEAVDVPRGIHKWCFRVIEPEQLLGGHADDVLPLEPLARRQLVRNEGLGLLARRLQPGHFPGDSGRAPIGHLAVKLVPSRLRGEEGLRFEGVLDELRGEGFPFCLRLILRVRLRRGHTCRCRPLPVARGQHSRAHYEQRTCSQISSSHWALPCAGAGISMDEESG